MWVMYIHQYDQTKCLKEVQQTFPRVMGNLPYEFDKDEDVLPTLNVRQVQGFLTMERLSLMMPNNQGCNA